MSSVTSISQIAWKWQPDSAEEQECDSNYSAMGMERCQKWNSYLRNETNKIELLRYLSGVIAQSNFDESKVVEASQGAFPGADPGGGRFRVSGPPFLSNYKLLL